MFQTQTNAHRVLMKGCSATQQTVPTVYVCIYVLMYVCKINT